MKIGRLWGVGMLSLLASSGVACGGVGGEPSEQVGGEPSEQVGGEPSEQAVSQASSALTPPPYAIRFAMNLLCLHDPVDGSLGLNGCSFDNDDKWKFNPNSPGFLVQTLPLSHCVSTYAQSNSGFSLRIQNCNVVQDLNHARWRILGRSGVPDLSLAYFKLQNVASGRCMTTRKSGSTWKVVEDTCGSATSNDPTRDPQELWLDTFNN